MSSHRVLSRKYLPTQLPVSFTLALYLLLDKFRAPGWVHGVAWTVMGIIWLAVLYGLWQEKHVEPKELLQ